VRHGAILPSWQAVTDLNFVQKHITMQQNVAFPGIIFQSLPRPPAGLQGPTSKGIEGRRWEGDGRGDRREGM